MRSLLLIHHAMLHRSRCHGLGPTRRRSRTEYVGGGRISLVVAIAIPVAPLSRRWRPSGIILVVVGHSRSWWLEKSEARGREGRWCELFQASRRTSREMEPRRLAAVVSTKWQHHVDWQSTVDGVRRRSAYQGRATRELDKLFECAVDNVLAKSMMTVNGSVEANDRGRRGSGEGWGRMRVLCAAGCSKCGSTRTMKLADGKAMSKSSHPVSWMLELLVRE